MQLHLNGTRDDSPIELVAFVQFFKVEQFDRRGISLNPLMRQQNAFIVDHQFGADVSSLRRVDAPLVTVSLAVFRVFAHRDINEPVVDHGHGDNRVSRGPFQAVD